MIKYIFYNIILIPMHLGVFLGDIMPFTNSSMVLQEEIQGTILIGFIIALIPSLIPYVTEVMKISKNNTKNSIPSKKWLIIQETAYAIISCVIIIGIYQFLSRVQ